MVGYYFLQMGFSEEQSFWILAYIIENLIPKGYYTDMTAVISDISLLKHMLTVFLPDMVSHFRKYELDINHFLVPWFLMAFTNMDNMAVNLKA